MTKKATAATFAAGTMMLAACGLAPRTPDLGGLYNTLAQQESPEHNPVIMIPLSLGAALIEKDWGDVVWGAFGLGRSPLIITKLFSTTLENHQPMEPWRKGIWAIS